MEARVVVSRLRRAQRASIVAGAIGSVLIAWPSRSEAYGLPKATLVVMTALACLGLAAVVTILRGRVTVPVGPVPIAMLALVVAMAAATLASGTPATAAIGPPRYTGLVPYIAYLALAVVLMVSVEPNRRQLILNCLLFAGGVEVVYGLLQAAGLQPLPFGILTVPVFGTLGNSNFLSGLLGITAAAALWVALDPARTGWWRRAAWALWAGSLITIWQSQSIQGIPAAAAGCAVVGLVTLQSDARIRSIRESWARLSARRKVPLVGGALAMLMLLTVVALSTVPRLIGMGGAARAEFWLAGWRLFLDNPVFGTGPGTFVNHYAAYYRPSGGVAFELADDPHSVFVAMLSGGGVVVFAAYLALVGVTGLTLFRGLRRLEGSDRILLGGLGGAWVAYQVQSAVSMDIPPLALTHWLLAASIALVARSVRFIEFPRPADTHEKSRRARNRPVPIPAGRRWAAAASLVLTGGLVVAATLPMRGVAAADEVQPLLDRGQPFEALETARRATVLAPWDDRGWAAYGRVAEGLRRFELAERAYGRAAALAPGTAAYALELADLTLRRSDLPESVRWNLHAARVDPRNLEVLERAARNLLTLGEGEEAERVLRRALALQETPTLWTALGLRHSLEGETQKATEAYERALAIDPANAEALRYLGRV